MKKPLLFLVIITWTVMMISNGCKPSVDKPVDTPAPTLTVTFSNGDTVWYNDPNKPTISISTNADQTTVTASNGVVLNVVGGVVSLSSLPNAGTGSVTLTVTVTNSTSKKSSTFSKNVMVCGKNNTTLRNNRYYVVDSLKVFDGDSLSTASIMRHYGLYKPDASRDAADAATFAALKWGYMVLINCDRNNFTGNGILQGITGPCDPHPGTIFTVAWSTLNSSVGEMNDQIANSADSKLVIGANTRTILYCDSKSLVLMQRQLVVGATYYVNTIMYFNVHP